MAASLVLTAAGVSAKPAPSKERSGAVDRLRAKQSDPVKWTYPDWSKGLPQAPKETNATIAAREKAVDYLSLLEASFDGKHFYNTLRVYQCGNHATRQFIGAAFVAKACEKDPATDDPACLYFAHKLHCRMLRKMDFARRKHIIPYELPFCTYLLNMPKTSLRPAAPKAPSKVFRCNEWNLDKKPIDKRTVAKLKRRRQEPPREEARNPILRGAQRSAMVRKQIPTGVPDAQPPLDDPGRSGLPPHG